MDNPFAFNPANNAACWKVELALPEQYIMYFSDALEEFADSQGFDEACLTLFFEHKPEMDELRRRVEPLTKAINIPLPDLTIIEQGATNWTAESQKDFEPFAVGNLYIHPPHQPADKKLQSIIIEPAASFGSGTHATTSGCLQALQLLQSQPIDSMLDMGCGSGILAIAMAKLWSKPVTAVDYDKHAVETTLLNAEHNHVTSLIEACESDGYSAALLKNKQYNLITSNLLANLLIAFSQDLTAHLAPSGFAILSGMLEEQKDEVLAVHQTLGLSLHQEIIKDGWCTLIMKK